jgi:outer membrane protein insertion porin family
LLRAAAATLWNSRYACVCLLLLAGSPAAQNASKASTEPQITAPASPPPAPSPTAAIPARTNGYEGLKVSEIKFEGVDGTDADRLSELLSQKLQEPFDKSKVRSSIQALHATGRFSDIQVQADRKPDNTVSLVFVAEENFFFGPMSLEGAPKVPRATQLLNATKLELGELFTREKLRRAMDRMKRLLQENGYYNAELTEKLNFRPEIQQVDVHFVVNAGEPARVGKINIEGSPGMTEKEVLDIAMLYPGDTVSSEEITKALDRLRRKYQEQDRLQAQVSLVNRQYHADSNLLDYTFKIVRGPTVDIHLEGADIPKRKLKRYVPIYEEGTVDEDLLNEGRRNLRDYFQQEGYFDVRMEVEEKYVPEQDHRHIIYDVVLGEQHELKEIVITGNSYFATNLIWERLAMRPSGGLLSRGRYSESILERDVEAIKALYHSNGFAQVEVEPEVQDDVNGQIGLMRVILRIKEGPQTIVRKFTVIGNSSIPTEQFLLNTAEGQPYSDLNIASDRDTILNTYFDRGFPNATMDYKVEPDPEDSTRVSVAYTINEGMKVSVDQVLVSGLHYTRPYIVDREMQVKEGGPLSQNEMFKTQRRLYDMGVFNEVNVAVQNPDGNARHKNILLHVDEARRYTINYGIGFEVQSGGEPVNSGTQTPTSDVRTGVSPRLALDVTRTNFMGRDHTVVFKTRVSRLQQRVLASYEAPKWFGNEDLRLTFTTLYDTSRDVNTFTAQRLEGAIQAEHIVTRNLSGQATNTFLYRLAYRRVKTEDLVVSPEDIPLFSRPVRIGMPSVTYIRDRRDDPINSTRGNFTTMDFGYASNLFGSALVGANEAPGSDPPASSRGFGRMLVQNSTYHSFGRNINRRYVFARSTRIGVAQTVGNTIIPLPERFFVGGGNSHRGFAINKAGPRDLQTGFVLGGSGMFVNNLELRLPPWNLPFLGENLAGVLFHDMGNAFERPEDIFTGLFRLQPTDACAAGTSARCDFRFFSHALGVGLRYRTPIGPVRIDLGYNLNPTLYPEGTELKRTDRINYFISIGQTF